MLLGSQPLLPSVWCRHQSPHSPRHSCVSPLLLSQDCSTDMRWLTVGNPGPCPFLFPTSACHSHQSLLLCSVPAPSSVFNHCILGVFPCSTCCAPAFPALCSGRYL